MTATMSTGAFMANASMFFLAGLGFALLCIYCGNHRRAEQHATDLAKHADAEARMRQARASNPGRRITDHQWEMRHAERAAASTLTQAQLRDNP